MQYWIWNKFYFKNTCADTWNLSAVRKYMLFSYSNFVGFYWKKNTVDIVSYTEPQILNYL